MIYNLKINPNLLEHEVQKQCCDIKLVTLKLIQIFLPYFN